MQTLTRKIHVKFSSVTYEIQPLQIGALQMNDETKISTLVDIYFEGMHESSAEKIKGVFHPNARIAGNSRGQLQEMTAAEFADFVTAQQPSPKAAGKPAIVEILSIDISGDTAVAKVRDNYLGLTFFDTLSLIKSDGNWVIYNKVYYIEK